LPSATCAAKKASIRFFAFLNLFMFSMLTLVLADNFVLMFVGWEGVGLCSYLLIGYYFDRKEAGDAAKKGVHHKPHRRLGLRARHIADFLRHWFSQFLREPSRR
jgi:hypothetical protein